MITIIYFIPFIRNKLNRQTEVVYLYYLDTYNLKSINTFLKT
jgi:hypothetical protein